MPRLNAMKIPACVLLTAAAIPVFAAGGSTHAQTAVAPRIILRNNVSIKRFYGYAYALKSGKYLYTQVQVQQRQGENRLGGSVTYYDPKGTEIGKNILSFGEDPYIPLYRLDDERMHYAQGVSKLTAHKVALFRRRGKDADIQRASLKRQDGMVSMQGLGQFVRLHFAQLEAGRTLKFQLISASQLKASQVSVRRTGEGQLEGHGSVRFKLTSGGWLSHWFSGQPIILIFGAEHRQLLEYRGPSELYDPKTKRPYRVRIDYFAKPPTGAPGHLPASEPKPG